MIKEIVIITIALVKVLLLLTNQTNIQTTKYKTKTIKFKSNKNSKVLENAKH